MPHNCDSSEYFIDNYALLAEHRMRLAGPGIDSYLALSYRIRSHERSPHFALNGVNQNILALDAWSFTDTI